MNLEGYKHPVHNMQQCFQEKKVKVTAVSDPLQAHGPAYQALSVEFSRQDNMG